MVETAKKTLEVMIGGKVLDAPILCNGNFSIPFSQTYIKSEKKVEREIEEAVDFHKRKIIHCGSYILPIITGDRIELKFAFEEGTKPKDIQPIIIYKIDNTGARLAEYQFNGARVFF